MKKYKPEQVKIANEYLKIMFTGVVSTVIQAYEPQIQGKYVPDDGTIYIFEHAENELKTKNSLLHEIMHAIDLFMNTELTENQVLGMTNGILMLAEDNKDLIKYLFNLENIEKEKKNGGDI